MRIDYVNQQIMDALLDGCPEVRYAAMPPSSATRGKTPRIISASGTVAYVLEESEIYFNLSRCGEEPGSFKPLVEDPDLTRIDNMLDPTMDIRVMPTGVNALRAALTGESRTRLTARFKGAAWDTFVDVDLLEAFDEAKYYQSKKNGPVAVVEDGKLVGFVMPCKAGDAEGHYTDTPSYEDE